MKSKLTYIKMPELFEELERYQSKFFGIIDSQVKDHLPPWIQASKHVYWLDHPEENKNLDSYARALSFFLELGLSRSSTLIAIGGGATTDFSGFVAATILRGVSWISVPTTLLAMIDGAIGGKVALNLPEGKNLVGAFHAPREVLVCEDFLSTLPELEWESGKGEVLKYAFLSSKIYELVIQLAPIEMIAFECAQFKKDIVEKDFREQGERIFLNLGHTLGHAFESNLKIPHGIAVAMGIKYMLKVFLPQKLNLFAELSQALNLSQEKTDLDFYPKFESQNFMKFLEQDKKKDQANIRLVLIEDIGKVVVQELPFTEFKLKLGSYAEFQY